MLLYFCLDYIYLCSEHGVYDFMQESDGSPHESQPHQPPSRLPPPAQRPRSPLDDLPRRYKFEDGTTVNRSEEVPETRPDQERSTSPTPPSLIQVKRAKSPQAQSTQMKSTSPERKQEADINVMWDRFQQGTKSGSESSERADVDLGRLYNLIRNPVQHLLHQVQTEREEARLEERTRDSSPKKSTPDKGAGSEQDTRPRIGSYTRFDIPVEKKVKSKSRRKSTRSPERRKMEKSPEQRKMEKSSDQMKMEKGSDQRKMEKSPERRKERSPERRQYRESVEAGRLELPPGDHRFNRSEFSKSEISNQMETSTSSAEDETASSTSSVSLGKKILINSREETLQSIPEDSTLESMTSELMTTSDSEGPGNYSRRHLPSDPRLLKLQQKIRKQKEKYLRECHREMRRRDKISKLEKLLTERGKTSSHHRGFDSGSSNSIDTSSALQTTSTGTLSTTKDMTESTLTEVDVTTTVVSDDESTLVENEVPQPSPSRKARHAETERHRKVVSKSPSPTRAKSKGAVASPKLKLRKVDYSEDKKRKMEQVGGEKPRKEIHRQSGSYLEFEKPAKTKSKMTSPKKSSEKRKSPKLKSRDRLHENKEASKVKNPKVKIKETKTREKQVWMTVKETQDVSTQQTPDKRSVGVNVPTPMLPSPPSRRTIQDVTMVSEAVQTSPVRDSENQENHRRSYRTKSPGRRSQSPSRRSERPGMFTPDSESPSENYDPEPKQQQHKDQQQPPVEKHKTRAAQCKYTCEFK